MFQSCTQLEFAACQTGVSKRPLADVAMGPLLGSGDTVTRCAALGDPSALLGERCRRFTMITPPRTYIIGAQRHVFFLLRYLPATAAGAPEWKSFSTQVRRHASVVSLFGMSLLEVTI